MTGTCKMESSCQRLGFDSTHGYKSLSNSHGPLPSCLNKHTHPGVDTENGRLKTMSDRKRCQHVGEMWLPFKYI